MADHVEDRLAALAEDAHFGPWGVSRNGTLVVRASGPRIIASVAQDKNFDVQARSTAAFIAAADPSTVRRLTAVVTAARDLDRDKHNTLKCARLDARPCPTCAALRDALAALDGEDDQ